MDKLIPKNRQFIVLPGEKMEWLAQELVQKKPDWFIPGKVDWKCHADGTPNIFIHDLKKLKNNHVLFLASHHSFQAKYMQLAVMYALTRSKIRTLTVSLPFIDTATMERVTREGEVATADVDAWLFSSLPRFGSPVEIIVYDLHTLQNQFYFHDGAVLTMVSGMNILKKRLTNMDNITICFPDAGAEKRFSSMFDGYPHIICKKVREGDGRKVTIASGDPTGRHVIIVDDMVQTGGTLLECQAELKRRGADKISAYVTHAIFPKESWRKFINAGFTHFFVTNSFPVSNQLRGEGPFEVLSITDDLITHLLANPEI